MTTTVMEFVPLFAGCTSVSDANTLYKRLHKDRCVDDPEAWIALAEAHRITMIRLTEGREPVHHEPTGDDSDRVRPLAVRNWARREGIPLARRGKVPTVVENQYRETHNLQPSTSTKDSSLASKARAWAREQGMEVGTRGRVHPDVLAAYTSAQLGSE